MDSMIIRKCIMKMKRAKKDNPYISRVKMKPMTTTLIVRR